MLSVMLALAVVASEQPAAAEPAAQAAFRAVLLKYDQRAEAETDVGRLRQLAVERAGELGQVLGQGLDFNGWDLILSGSEATPSRPLRVRTGSCPPFVVWSKTLRSFSLSNIISSRLRPVRSKSEVNSMASQGHASSHMPQ